MSLNIIRQVEEYYTKKIEIHGAVPQGVDWKDRASQECRFVQLLKVIKNESSQFSINDLGCGYGSLFSYVKKNFKDKDFLYQGYDLSGKMIEKAIEIVGDVPDCKFMKISSGVEMSIANYTVASGIFNVKMKHDENEWLKYILETLEQINYSSTKGFSFNMLTKYSDEDKKRSDLYYGDPCFFFDLCKRKYSRNIALYHDYELYEFTLIVRK